MLSKLASQCSSGSAMKLLVRSAKEYVSSLSQLVGPTQVKKYLPLSLQASSSSSQPQMKLETCLPSPSQLLRSLLTPQLDGLQSTSAFPQSSNSPSSSPSEAILFTAPSNTAIRAMRSRKISELVENNMNVIVVYERVAPTFSYRLFSGLWVFIIISQLASVPTVTPLDVFGFSDALWYGIIAAEAAMIFGTLRYSASRVVLRMAFPSDSEELPDEIMIYTPKLFGTGVKMSKIKLNNILGILDADRVFRDQDIKEVDLAVKGTNSTYYLSKDAHFYHLPLLSRALNCDLSRYVYDSAVTHPVDDDISRQKRKIESLNDIINKSKDIQNQMKKAGRLGFIKDNNNIDNNNNNNNNNNDNNNSSSKDNKDGSIIITIKDAKDTTSSNIDNENNNKNNKNINNQSKSNSTDDNTQSQR